MHNSISGLPLLEALLIDFLHEFTFPTILCFYMKKNAPANSNFLHHNNQFPLIEDIFFFLALERVEVNQNALSNIVDLTLFMKSYDSICVL